MGGLALELDGLGAVNGHDVPLRDVVDSRTLLTGPVFARFQERVGVERCSAIRDGLD